MAQQEIAEYKEGHSVGGVSDVVTAHVDTSESTVKLSRKGLPLIPQPSDDPFNPLNWSPGQKALLFAVLVFWVYQGTSNMLNIAPAFFDIAAELNSSLTVSTYLVGGPLLAYGVASLFWVALGNRFGVRLCFVASSLISGVLCIWGAKANSFGSLTAARTLASAFMASCETLGPQAIADVFFLDQRAACVAIFVLFQASGNSLGSLQGAYIAANMGWRWIQWIQAILCFVSCLLMFLFFPETQYTRASVGGHKRKRSLLDNLKFSAVSGGGRRKVQSFWVAFLYPLRYAAHPAVLAMTATFSIMLMVTEYALTSNTFIFVLNYGFDTKAVGLTALAPQLGILLGVPFSGYLNDWYLRRTRLDQEHQPEARLSFFLVTAVLSPVGCIIMGVCAQDRQSYWAVLVGEGMITFTFFVAATLTQTYLVDVYIARADATLVIMNGLKNFAAFGMLYAVVPWNTKSGYSISFGVLAIITVVGHLPILLFWWRGARIRAWSEKVWKEARPTHHGDCF